MTEKGSVFSFGELLVTSEIRAQERQFRKKGELALVLSEPVCPQHQRMRHFQRGSMWL